MRYLLLLALLLAPCCAMGGAGGPNLLKNGSFEGGKRYWFEADEPGRAVVKADAADGEHALRIDSGGVASAAFLLEQEKPVTLSFSAKSIGGDATMGWQLTPCSREVGAKAGLTWSMKAHHPVQITGQWKRYSFTFTPTVPQDGFWPRPTYMAQIGDCERPFLLDGVVVAYGAGADRYVPRREIEVGVDSPDLKGYRDISGNMLKRGQEIELVGNVSNPGKVSREATIRWQFIDYEGKQPLGPAVEKKVVVPAGATLTDSARMKLDSAGMVLGRFSAVAADGAILDSSDLPLCSLPYPCQATKPDPRERFGGSLVGPHNAALCARMGFAWARWRPHMNWADHQKNAGDPPSAWTWFDSVLDEQESLGISTHAVLYGKPKWAFASEKAQLPRDMDWPAGDKRWDDLSIRTAWDTFVVEAVKHYRGRSLVYEIENEPEFDGWEDKNDLYARFTIRTARLIKQADPDARVMVDNVYGIPSGLNRFLLEKVKEQGAVKLIDIISWHDYHEGWLADAKAIRRMRAAIDDLGFGHVQIWFNEGWAFTNTIVDEPAVALTHLNAAQSTNAMVDSVAEMTAAGQEKTILFHTGYEDHGMSFWDYAGPGTMLWDYYGYPLPLVPAWNTLVHHIGLSERVGLIRPEGASFCIFQDLRSGRGVMVAYADRGAETDVTVQLPETGMIAEDAMGNAVALKGGAVILSRTGRPVFVYSPAKTPGNTLLEKMAPLDRKNASFVATAAGANKSWKLPPAWEGKEQNSTKGNPAVADGKPIWRLDQVWPDAAKPENFRPLAWHDGWWVALKDGFGGQPKAEMKDGAVRLEFRAPHTQSPGEKLCGVTFIAPAAGAYAIEGTAELNLWENADNRVRLAILHKTAKGIDEIASVALKKGRRVPTGAGKVSMAAGDELTLLPRIEGMFTGGDVTLSDLTVSGGEAATSGITYRLPRAWEGPKKGTADGNPVSAGGQPLWRLDGIWPEDPTIAKNYTPLQWTGTAWFPENGGMGGQPEASVNDGAFKVAVRGPWGGGGESGHPRTAGLAFIAPAPGVYHVTATASSKPWTGNAKSFKLGIFKKDAQRATQEKVFELPRDGKTVSIDFTVELAAGHELFFIPLMDGQWNNATTTTVDDLAIGLVKEP